MDRKSWLVWAAVATAGSAGCATVQRAPLVKEPSTGMELVYVKGGCFQMGNTFEAGGPEERPVHKVCLDDFYLGKYEVTQAQWNAVMGESPSYFASCGDSCPVEMVSWNDAQEFIARLNSKRGAGERSVTYRLPTEAEWEYAARSGGKRELYAGGSSEVDAIAWYERTALSVHPVGTKMPNGLGLFDMSGNVWEWTSDWYDETYYSRSPRKNPTGPPSGERRVLRGGGFANHQFDLRTTYRNYLPPDHRANSKGLRLVRTAR